MEATSVLENCEETTKKFVEILQSNGITDTVLDVTVENSNLVGAGFASQTKHATITFEDSSKPKLNLFVKTLMNSVMHQGILRLMRSFEKESMFFMKYLPEAKQLCEAKGQAHLLDIYPKCYYGDENMIVLENLALDKGYALISKDDMQNMEEAKVGLTTLAKHHAISYAMIESVGGSGPFFEKFVDLNYDGFAQPANRAMLEPMLNMGVLAYTQLLEKCTSDGSKEALEILQTNMGKVYGHLEEVLVESLDHEPLIVLNHGDYWNNNMMYLKDDKGKILHHKAIDFQVSRYNSPTVDLGYYIFTSVQPAVRKDHIWDLLRFYLKTLKSTAADLGCAIELSEEDFFARFKHKFKLGWWSAVNFSSGPVFQVMKSLDMNNLETPDFAAMTAMFIKLIQEWIANNEETGAGMVKDIIHLVIEYNILMNNN